MRLLSSLRAPRDAAVDEPAAAAAPPLEGEAFASAQVIGARQERLGAELAEVVQLATRLQALAPMADRLSSPLAAEFEAHRRDHAEMQSLKVHNGVLSASLKTLRETEQAVRRQLGEAGRVNEAARGEVETLRKSLADTLGEKAGLQEALGRAHVGGEDLKAELGAAQNTARQLEEDANSLRARLGQAGERRRELDALSARARQDADLAEAENASLRHRIDDLSEQLVRVTRAEAQAQAEVASERERAAAQVTEAERVARESVAQAQAFEAQLVVVRGQTASIATRADAAGARNAKLERLCVDLSAKANEAVSQRQALESAAGDSQAVLQRALERVEQLERTAAEAKSAHLSLDRARLTALERGDQLTAALHAAEGLLARSEARAQTLEESLQTLAAEEEALRRSHEDDATRLSGEVRRLESDLHIQQAALKAAREHRSFAA